MPRVCPFDCLFLEACQRAVTSAHGCRAAGGPWAPHGCCVSSAWQRRGSAPPARKQSVCREPARHPPVRGLQSPSPSWPSSQVTPHTPCLCRREESRLLDVQSPCWAPGVAVTWAGALPASCLPEADGPLGPFLLWSLWFWRFLEWSEVFLTPPSSSAPCRGRTGVVGDGQLVKTRPLPYTGGLDSVCD